MKKIIRIIKLRKYKNKVIVEYLKNSPNEDEFYILYKNGTYEYVYFKDDLIDRIEKDHLKPIRYIFDATDRIIVDRDIKVDISEVE